MPARKLYCVTSNALVKNHCGDLRPGLRERQIAETRVPNCWAPEGSLAGFWGAFLKSGGPGKPCKNVGGEAPHILKSFPGPRGRPDFKNAPKNIGQTASMYPELVRGCSNDLISRSLL